MQHVVGEEVVALAVDGVRGRAAEYLEVAGRLPGVPAVAVERGDGAREGGVGRSVRTAGAVGCLG